MFSSVVLICVLSAGTCESFAPSQVYKTEAQCVKVSEGAKEYALSNATNPSNIGLVFKCVNWGKPA